MSSEIKKRIYTGSFLIMIFILMFLSKIIYLYTIIIVFVLAFIEFANISSRIFRKKKIYYLFSNIIFLSYLSIVLMITFLGVNGIHFKLVLYVILLTCIASDIGGITFGKIFKGPKLTNISPNKTISGSVGSVLFSFIPLIILNYFFPENFLLSKSNIIFCFEITVVCQLGDLLISFFKRKAKVKDTGKILPGHGGLLDRIDGIIFALPYAYNNTYGINSYLNISILNF